MSIEQQIAEHAERLGVDQDYAEYRHEIELEIEGHACDKLSMSLQMHNMPVLAEIFEQYDSEWQEIACQCYDYRRSYRNRNDAQSHSMIDDFYDVVIMGETDRAACDRLAREFAFYLNYESAINAEIAHRDEVAAEKAAGI